MGTKLTPDSFDCYAAALADEPMFILLARDPQAPDAIEHWARSRPRQSREDKQKLAEATACAEAMRAWRRRNEGRWREPVPAINGSSAGLGRLVEVSTDGRVTIEREQALEESHLYAGVRAAALGPDPRDPTKEVVSILGGFQDEPDFMADGVTFAMSQPGLRALAAELVAAADRVRDRTVFDARFVL